MSTVFINSFLYGGLPPVTDSRFQFWIDFSDIATLYQDEAMSTPVSADADPIGAVADKSGNARNVTQGTPGSRPLYKAAIKNNRSVGRFDGTDDFLASSAFTLNQPIHIFAVGKFNATLDFLLDGSTRNSGSLVSISSTELRLFAGVGLNNSNLVLGNYHVFTQQINGASSSNQIDNGTAATGNAGADNMSGVTIGMSGVSRTLPLSGDVCEVLIYSGLLNSSEEATTNEYLNNRWAIY